MRDITCFSANFLAQFENDYNNVLKFNGLMMDAAHSVYSDVYKRQLYLFNEVGFVQMYLLFVPVVMVKVQ